MIKRGLFVIIFIAAVVLNFITFLPITLMGFLWVATAEILSWIIRGRTIIKDPLLTVMDNCFWGAIVLEYIERKLKLDI